MAAGSLGRTVTQRLLCAATAAVLHVVLGQGLSASLIPRANTSDEHQVTPSSALRVSAFYVETEMTSSNYCGSLLAPRMLSCH